MQELGVHNSIVHLTMQNMLSFSFSDNQHTKIVSIMLHYAQCLHALSYAAIITVSPIQGIEPGTSDYKVNTLSLTIISKQK